MDCRLLASDGDADHRHILLEYPPKLSVSVLVNAFKGHVKSDAYGQTSPLAIATVFCGRRPISLRRPVGAPIIRQYVEQQRQRASSLENLVMRRRGRAYGPFPLPILS
jgi:putative transposase